MDPLPVSVTTESMMGLLFVAGQYSHAVPGRQVSVHKLLAGQVLHAFGYLQPEAHEVFDCGVLCRQGDSWRSDTGSVLTCIRDQTADT